ncbi:FtsK/SpoIIIE domain-containing protein, partial [Jatrophihabitans endophyticus]|uniref:FtsK/SpoIIIE domain-containing protein n=1 Tax=Jatrophihabitans endophyticus TaxID=1206085 RepID=UPI0019DC007F
NTNLRLALRMADETDSLDVLGSTEAAFFDPSLPGRAVSKTGPGRLVPFQTGYAGGWTAEEPPAPDILVEELTFGAGVEWAVSETVDATPVDPGPTDIRRMVESVRVASETAQIEQPRRPWLPELRAVYDLSDQKQVPTRRTDSMLVYGVRDDPDNQSQPTVAFEPDRDGNLAVYGTGGSGKSTLLRSLAVSAGFTIHGGPCHVYGIDFGARGLAMLDDLPHVGSIVPGSDHERITRLLSWLRGLIDERALRYSRAHAGTITDYRESADAPDEPRILLLVDGVAAFRQAYETSDRQRWFDVFAGLATDGRPVGVHVVVSSEQRSGLPTALASAVQRRVVLRLASAEEYSLLGVPADVLSLTSPPGRALLDEDEIQVAMLGNDVQVGAQAEAMKRFGEAMRQAGATPAPPIRKLPETVRFADLPPAVDGRPVLGMEGESLAPLPFDPSGAFIISGPPGSGRTSSLIAVARAIRRALPSTRLVLFSARDTALTREAIWSATATGVGDVSAAA